MKLKSLIFVCALLLWNACGSDPAADRPVIGVLYGTAQAVFLKAGVDINSDYKRALEHSGAGTLSISVFDDNKEIMAALGRIDGVLIPGGFDVSPTRYGELPEPQLETVDALLDDLEYTVLRYCDDKQIPLLGICRGCQVINVYYGGSLYQDIPARFGGAVAHRERQNYLIYNHAIPCFHEIKAAEETRLAEMLGAGAVSLNTYHHQGVKKLAPKFIPAAMSADGLIEAVELSGPRFVLGVQFHPEKMYRDNAIFSSIFDAFVKAAAARRDR